MVEAKLRAKTVWLIITSWRGISFGAIHFYGDLKIEERDSKDPWNDDGNVELQRTLTKSQAKELTKLQNDNSLFGLKHTYRVGDTTRSFDTKEDIIEFAKTVYRLHYPNATKLVLGDTIYDEPECTLHEVIK